MPNLIIYEEKNVEAKGLNPNNKISPEKLKNYFFEDDYQNLELLNEISIPFEKREISLLYPGCGADILFPLIYLDKLFPQLNEAIFTFVDEDNNLGMIKTILDEVGISFEENKNQIEFHWNQKLITLTFIVKKIEDYFQELKNHDIYFEKAFRIMRNHIPNYEGEILNKLNPNAIIISDTGFGNQNLKQIAVSKELSSYKEMIIGIKEV
jgi:hypothetical protein